MEPKIKVSAVSYLNTKPLLYGFHDQPITKDIYLKFEYPALIAKDLIEGNIDLGLVPVAAIPKIPNAKIICDYGIGADDDVASVCIYSQVPLEKITHLYLDYQSRTSVKLAQLLLKKYWKKNVELLAADEHYISGIRDTKAGVIIGDRALKALNDFEYIYDLSGHWKRYTGLPFIFAAWVANKDLPAAFIRQFTEANKYGLSRLDAVILENPCSYYDLKTYYTKNIHFSLTPEMYQGLARFLEEISE